MEQAAAPRELDLGCIPTVHASMLGEIAREPTMCLPVAEYTVAAILFANKGIHITITILLLIISSFLWSNILVSIHSQSYPVAQNQKVVFTFRHFCLKGDII